MSNFEKAPLTPEKQRLTIVPGEGGMPVANYADVFDFASRYPDRGFELFDEVDGKKGPFLVPKPKADMEES